MWNPFKKSENKSNLNIDFDLINNIYQYLETTENPVLIDVKDQLGQFEAAWFNFPDYYKSSTNEVLKENGFDNFYQILNKKYASANIDTIDTAQAIASDDTYTILEFSFATTPVTENEKLIFKKVTCFFYFILVSTRNSNLDNGFRVFFTRPTSIYSVVNFINAKYVADINNPENNALIYAEALERNLVALSQHLKLPISSKLQKKYPESLLLGAVTENDIKRLIQLISRNLYDYDVDQLANELFTDYQKNWEELNDEADHPTQQYFPNRYDVLLYENCWFTDWKFNPEDADAFIGNIIHPNNLEGIFEYPENTYSHNLFPYIQAALDKMDLQLMDLDCEGDSYCFFVVNKQDVAEVLNLSQKIKIGVEKVY